MDSAAKWRQRVDVSFLHVDGAKEEKSFAFNLHKFSTKLDRGISKIFKAGYSGELSLRTKLFRIYKTGNFKIRVN